MTGLRPGEKLAEALIGPAERSVAEYGDLLHSIEPVALGPAALAEALETLEQLAINDEHVAARAALLALARPAARDAEPDPDQPLHAS